MDEPKHFTETIVEGKDFSESEGPLVGVVRRLRRHQLGGRDTLLAVCPILPGDQDDPTTVWGRTVAQWQQEEVESGGTTLDRAMQDANYDPDRPPYVEVYEGSAFEPQHRRDELHQTTDGSHRMDHLRGVVEIIWATPPPRPALPDDL